MGRRIALIGSAPSSVQLAPYKDPGWSIWACSPGAYPVVASQRELREGDAFFELHRWEPPVLGAAHLQVPWFSPEYVAWLQQLPVTVYTGEVVPEIKNGVRLPREHLQGRYGPYFFTSSLAWMLAMALEQPDLEEIGLWGVDMAATEEYATQRPGCQYFLQIAMQRGVRVTVPPESDLIQPPFQYGVDEWNPMAIKLTARMKELSARLANTRANLGALQREEAFLTAAIDSTDWTLKTWVGTAGLGMNQMPRPEVSALGEEVKASLDPLAGTVMHPSYGGVALFQGGDSQYAGHHPV